VRVAVLSDIHANLTALDAVVADIQMRAPDAVVVRRVEYNVEEEVRELRARGCPDADWTAATLLAAAPQPSILRNLCCPERL
jgi:hypothetical protein